MHANDMARTLAASVAIALLATGCWNTGDRQEGRAPAARAPSASGVGSPTAASAAEARPRCRLGRRSDSGDTVVIYLLRRGKGAQMHPVRVHRSIDAVDRRALLNAALRHLASGTTARERRAGCESYFDSTDSGVLRGVALDGSEATIDFDGDSMFALGATDATSRFLDQLTRTVFQFGRIDSIHLLLDGSCEKFGKAVQSLRCETIRRDELSARI